MCDDLTRYKYTDWHVKAKGYVFMPRKESVEPCHYLCLPKRLLAFLCGISQALRSTNSAISLVSIIACFLKNH